MSWNTSRASSFVLRQQAFSQTKCGVDMLGVQRNRLYAAAFRQRHDLPTFPQRSPAGTAPEVARQQFRAAAVPEQRRVEISPGALNSRPRRTRSRPFFGSFSRSATRRLALRPRRAHRTYMPAPSPQSFRQPNHRYRSSQTATACGCGGLARRSRPYRLVPAPSAAPYRPLRGSAFFAGRTALSE